MRLGVVNQFLTRTTGFDNVGALDLEPSENTTKQFAAVC